MRIVTYLLGALALAGAALLLMGGRTRQAVRPWPEGGLHLPGFELAGMSVARYRGGDYHDIFVAPDRNSMVIAVGDVAGHDALAARLMRVAAGLLRADRARPGHLGAQMSELNRRLVPHMRAGRFMTLFLAVLVGPPRELHWVSAGHGPVMAYDPVQDRFAEVPGSDIPLGIDGTWRFREHIHSGWETGALLLVGTDGIWETRSPDGRMYGKERFLRVVRSCRHLPAVGMIDAVASDLARFRQGRPAGDDVTLVIVKAV